MTLFEYCNMLAPWRKKNKRRKSDGAYWLSRYVFSLSLSVSLSTFIFFFSPFVFFPFSSDSRHITFASEARSRRGTQVQPEKTKARKETGKDEERFLDITPKSRQENRENVQDLIYFNVFSRELPREKKTNDFVGRPFCRLFLHRASSLRT